MTKDLAKYRLIKVSAIFNIINLDLSERRWKIKATLDQNIELRGAT